MGTRKKTKVLRRINKEIMYSNIQRKNKNAKNKRKLQGHAQQQIMQDVWRKRRNTRTHTGRMYRPHGK